MNMKMTKILTALLLVALVLSLAACSKPQANGGNMATEDNAANAIDDLLAKEASTAEEATALHTQLMDAETAILNENSALWEKVFLSADKGSAMIEDGSNYGDFLLKTIESAKDEFTEDELKLAEKDLQKMIDKGYFGETTYLNLELGYLFRSSEADEALRKEKQQQETSRQEPPKQETMTDYDVILQKIRNANDRIADEALSAKIDQLESITARIFKAVEADPAKRGKIDTFLNYYLPTTQKLLDSYAEFEAAGVEGENLRQAKGRIEAAMDSIVRGFTHQLDELYQADAMDVDSDLRVMENMLRRDTATVAQDFGLDQK